GTSDHRMIRLTKDAQIHPGDGRVVIRRNKLVLNVQPLLSFTDRSPDRCWTALAPAEETAATARTLLSKVHDGARWLLFHRDDDKSALDLTTRDDAIVVDARSRLGGPIFSHLNSF